jgi:hypothetical protein
MRMFENAEVVKEYPSKSNPARKYHVTKDREGILFCDCPAWRFMKKPSHLRQCSHILNYVEDKANEATV